MKKAEDQMREIVFLILNFSLFILLFKNAWNFADGLKNGGVTPEEDTEQGK